MLKAIITLVLLIVPTLTNASLLKIDISAIVTADDFTIFEPGTFCCQNELTTWNVEYSTLIDLDEFVDYGFGNEEFLHYNKSQSTLVINGIKPAEKFIGTNNAVDGVYHTIQPAIEYINDPSRTYSTFRLVGGVSFSQETRFQLTDNLYLRELNFEGFLDDLNTDITDPNNLERFLNVLENDANSLYGYRSVFWIGDSNNSEDNVNAIGWGNVSSINFQLVEVPEPSSLIIFSLALFGLRLFRFNQ